MAKQTTTSILASLGEKVKQAHEAHKADDTDYGSGGRLPDGIEGGIAQLSEAKFGRYRDGDNKNQPYFIAQAVVIRPEYHNGLKVAGKQTMLGPLPLCDTKNAKGEKFTFNDNYGFFLNKLRILGVETAELSHDQVETAIELLKKSKPLIQFRTWKGKKQTEGPYAGKEPLVKEVWEGIVSDLPPDQNGQAEEQTPITDNSGEAGAEDLDDLVIRAQEADPDAQEELVQRAIAAGVSRETAENMDTWAECADLSRGSSAGEAGDLTAEAPDYIALGASADEGDEGSMEALQAAAIEFGLDPDSDDYSDSWGSLADALTELGGASEAPPDEPFKPSKGDNFRVLLVGGAKSKVDCEVLSVSESNETVTLKNMITGKPVIDAKTKKPKAFKWSEIQ